MGIPLKDLKPNLVFCDVEAVSADTERSVRRLISVAEEVPIAFRYNDFSHAVMMATPADLEDFAFGFSLTEGIISGASGIATVTMRQGDDGLIADIALDAASLHRYLAGRRVRQLRGHTSCGLCGVEDLADLRRPSPRSRKAEPLEVRMITDAFAKLRDLQPLSLSTRGAHAAAWVGRDGAIQTVREDVGRHNALDKLIGVGLRSAFFDSTGFCLITSRCSYEMVQKAALAGYATLVSASAPTALAVHLAQTTGLTLYSLSKDGLPIQFTALPEKPRCAQP
jgi:FdhD protein